MEKRILIAEDDPSIQLLEKKILENAGYRVDCAESGDVAFEMVKSNRYMLVITDVMMPGMDGFQLTKEIYRLFHRSIPVLLVTAVHDALTVAHEKDAKPLSTLQKPFTPSALLTAVRLLEAQVEKSDTKVPEERTSSREEKKKSWFDKLFHPAGK
jgi:two-component system alkaline phosphatase synthesis response regulator PhoP